MKSVQSVERSFAILDVLAAGPCGLSEAARRVGLPKSTVARLMGTLEAIGAVDRVGDAYVIGRTVRDLAGPGSTSSRLIALARPHLERLAVEANEAAGLTVADGDRMHTIAQVDVDRTVQARDWTGELAMIHSVPSGLIFMAHWPADQLDEYLGRELRPATSLTLVDPDRIRTRLASIRDQGYAWGKEEFHDGINSVAAPVKERRGAIIAAVHLHGPAFRFPEPGAEDAVGRIVKSAADRMSRDYAEAAPA